MKPIDENKPKAGGEERAQDDPHFGDPVRESVDSEGNPDEEAGPGNKVKDNKLTDEGIEEELDNDRVRHPGGAFGDVHTNPTGSMPDETKENEPRD